MLKYLPNTISILRLLCTPLLAWLAVNSAAESFAWLLFAAGISDILDGWLARKLQVSSDLGALLDSIADVLLTLVTLFAIGYLHSYVFLDHGFILGVFISTWVCVHLAALYRYRKLASFHTLLTRIAIILFGVFALSLFFFQFIDWLWYLAGILGVLAAIENLIMIFLLPDWRPNLRGGLISVLRKPTDPN